MRGILLSVWCAVMPALGCAPSRDVTSPAPPVQPPAAMRVDSLIAPWHDTARVRIANVPAGASVTWAIADTVVATIDAQGVVTGRKGGATIVTAMAGDQKASAVVRVEMQFDRVALAARTTCARVRRGDWYCWGDNFSSGWIVYPRGSEADWPTANGLAAFTDIIGGGSATLWCAEGCAFQRPGFVFCGILSTGRVDCWGTAGQGLATSDAHTVKGGPPPLTTDSTLFPVPIQSVGVGIYHGCGLDPGGTAYCWGLNTSSQLGVATPAPTGCSIPHNTYWACSGRPLQVETTLRFRQIAAGYTTTCAVAVDASLWCWGRTLLPGGTNGLTPTQVPLGAAMKQVVVGAAHACGLTIDGTALCWGANDKGQLGTGAPDATRHGPAPVADAVHFRELATHLDATCGVTTEEAVYCWGDNLEGQIGDGTRENRAIPTRAHLDLPMVQVRISDDHTCALSARGAAFCWGVGSYGQLGVGAAVGSTEPRQVITPP